MQADQDQLMRARRPVWLVAMVLALLAAPGSALAESGRKAAPDPTPLWQAYPLGTQPLAKTGHARRVSVAEHTTPPARSADTSVFGIAFPGIVAATVALFALAIAVPLALQRRRFQPRYVAAGAPGQPPPRRSEVRHVNGSRPQRAPTLPPEPADVVAVAPVVVDARSVRTARRPARPDEAFLRYAAAYADASQRGDPAPMAAVRAVVPSVTKDPAGYAKRMIAEARRRDLLTSHGRGRAGGELTPKALELLQRSPGDGRYV